MRKQIWTGSLADFRGGASVDGWSPCYRRRKEFLGWNWQQRVSLAALWKEMIRENRGTRMDNVSEMAAKEGYEAAPGEGMIVQQNELF